MEDQTSPGVPVRTELDVAIDVLRPILVEGLDQQHPDAEALRTVLDAVADLRTERAATLRVLAPDVATGDRTLPQVAEAALAVARRGGKL